MMVVTDNTKLIVEDWAFKKENNLSKLILFRTNRGKSPALNKAFQSAQGDIVITMDADLQDDPKEIKNFVSKINEGYDFVVVGKLKEKIQYQKPSLQKYLIILLQKFLELNSTTLIVVLKHTKIRLLKI